MKQINGKFNTTINNPSGSFVLKAAIIEIPIIPPSIIELGTRKHSIANAAMNAPTAKNNKLIKVFFI